jgi:ankyrin repeat protein
MRASFWGNTEITHQLLQAGASTAIVDGEEKTALTIAVGRGQHVIVQLLIEHGASVQDK